MKQVRVPSVPLITCDPYFSIWSPHDTLNGGATCSWTGAEKIISGTVTVDGKALRFLGAGEEEAIPQVGLEIAPTSSRYRFEGAGIQLDVVFTTPLLLTDLELVSRPASYLNFAVRSTGGAAHDVSVTVSFDEGHCYHGVERRPLVGGAHKLANCAASWMGRKVQTPLGHSGDDITIDWGYLYLAIPDACPGETLYREGDRDSLSATLYFDGVGEKDSQGFLVAGYDDIASINYFGDICRGYWARDGKSILTALEEAVAERDSILTRCAVFDGDLTARAEVEAGEDYAHICALAYRQSIAAHKLIADLQGNVVFLSKECFSNGCVGTVDVSYPSIPLYLLYQPELVKGMLRPVLRFARMPVWTYDFAPHDVGRYPYVTGQVYGIPRPEGVPRPADGEVYPMYYQFPGNVEVYDLRHQMPVEECGNMLIMAAAVARVEGCAAFIQPHMDLMEQWVGYLIRFGGDPGEQLCTDDFAGHLARNVNLAAKAVMGIQSYAELLTLCGRVAEAGMYHRKAAEMAAHWMEEADRGDHTALTFGGEGWSLKYNLIWDRIFGSGLFGGALYRREIRWYLGKENRYGVPLDSRKDYTKSDWILWVAAMTEDKGEREALIRPIVRFLEETPDRVPFCDWYDTATGKQSGFQNRTVQGGLFMPLLKRMMEGE